MPFDEPRREAFLDEIRSGVRSHREACRILSINRSTFNRWIERGKQLDKDDDEGAPYRAFVVALRAAESSRDAMPEKVVHKAALEDYRAALPILQLAERRQQRRDGARLRKANAERAEAEAKVSQLNAETLERQLRKNNGRLYMAPEMAALMNDEERTALRGFMVRAKLVSATEEELEAEQAEITDEDYEFNRQLAEELGFIPRTTPEATADQAAPPEE